jgi:hypothetical protein
MHHSLNPAQPGFTPLWGVSQWGIATGTQRAHIFFHNVGLPFRYHSCFEENRMEAYGSVGCTPCIFLFLGKFYPHFLSNFDLVLSLQLPNGLGRRRSSHASSETVLLNTHPLNPEANCTNVSEETLFNWRPRSTCRHPARHKESLERDEPSKAPLAKPSPSPDDAGPILRCPMGLPITAGYDTVKEQTGVCSDASSTAMECLRPWATREAPYTMYIEGKQTK